jgi:hypothetical protein
LQNREAPRLAVVSDCDCGSEPDPDIEGYSHNRETDRSIAATGLFTIGQPIAGAQAEAICHPQDA